MKEVFEDTGGNWYFYDETWDRTGPFSTEARAIRAFERYCEEELGVKKEEEE